MSPSPVEVSLEPWSAGDLDLLRRLNAPELMVHLGGPETDEQVRTRHREYLRYGFPAIVLPTGERVGAIGYWSIEWLGRTVWEAGWKVLPEFQGRGIATAALAEVVARARAERKHSELHAFPSVDNAASNAICRKVGFALAGQCEVAFPKGHWMRCNDWRLDLDPPHASLA